MLQNPVGIELESEAINSYGLEGFIDDNDAGDDSEGRPLFPPPTFQLNDNCMQQLQFEIPSLWTSSNVGIDVFLKGLDIVQHY